MYYLFIKKQKDIIKYRIEFDRVSAEIKAGKTPVFSELRCAKTNLIETIPYNVLNGVFLILGTMLLNKLHINEIISVAVVLIINNLFGVVSNYIFTVSKHYLRLKLCDRIGVERCEHSIAVMESLEYMSL